MIAQGSSLILWLVLGQVQLAPTPTQAPSLADLKTPREVKSAFLKMLDRPKVAPDVQINSIEANPSVGLVAERLTFASEMKGDGKVERVPVLLVRPAASGVRRPAVIALHGTGGNKDGMDQWLTDLAKRGIIGVAIDARYHGDRSKGAKGSAAYVDAITRAWESKPGEAMEHPFYYDTCWDLWRTIDYLQSRPDIDPKRIGMFGSSMGGIETWLAGAVDERVAVAVPAIGVQSFKWSMENNAWQGRANTIKAAHEAAAKDLKAERVNARVCLALWNKVIPGILGPFDCPSMIRLFAGRPLLILNGEKDLNCPLGGAKVAFKAAEDAFKDAGATDRLKIMVAQGVGHAISEEQRQATLDWFTQWLKP